MRKDMTNVQSPPVSGNVDKARTHAFRFPFVNTSLHVRILVALLDNDLIRARVLNPCRRRQPTVSSLWGEQHSSWDFTRKFLESLALSLWDQERGEQTTNHEESEDLHDVVEPRRWAARRRMALGFEGTKDSL